MRRLVALAVLFVAFPARADSGEGVSLFPSTGPFRAGAEIETAAFRAEGKRGSYESVIARVEYATKHISLRLRVPWDTLALGDKEGTTEGFADSELRARVVLKSGDPLRISGGVVTNLPTGARHEGLGNGSTQLSPFLNAGYRVDRLIVYATVADSLSVVRYPTDGQKYPNYTDPSSDHELRVTVGSLFELDEAVAAGVVVTDTIILTEVERGIQIVDGSLQVGAQPDKRLRLVISPSLPLAGQQRFSWKLNAAATISF